MSHQITKNHISSPKDSYHKFLTELAHLGLYPTYKRRNRKKKRKKKKKEEVEEKEEKEFKKS